MTLAAFRKLALACPGATEGSHLAHPDFRVEGRIFASIPKPPEPRAMVRLSPEQQRICIAEWPDAFSAANGAWGRQGCTFVDLRKVGAAALKQAVRDAWLLASSR